MAGYSITSTKGKQIASSMKAGDTYKASDGSTWKKNSNGTVSVTTASGGYTANAYGGSSGSGGVSKNLSNTLGSENVSNSSMLYGDDTTMQEITGGGSTAPSRIPKGTVNAGYNNSTNTANNAYFDALEKQRRAAEKAARIRTQATIDSIKANIPKVNQDYENQQAQNYISHTKNMFGLSDFLRAQGISGGMSESKATELQAGYETNRNTAYQNKNNALQYYQGLAAQAQATGDESLAKIATDYYNNYAAEVRRQEEAAAQAERDAQAQSNWQTQFDANQQQYKDSLTQQQFENNLATQEYNLALQAAQKAKTSGRSGGGSTGTKLTASTINNMLDDGLIDAQQAAAMYSSIGINIPTQTHPTTNYYAEADRLIQQRTVPSSRAALIKQWNLEGKLTDAQAYELLRRYGLPTN